MQIIKAESEFCHPGIDLQLLINNYGIRIANFKLAMRMPYLLNSKPMPSCQNSLSAFIICMVVIRPLLIRLIGVEKAMLIPK